MKILFIVSSFNGLSQRAWLELDRLSHQVKVHVVSSDETLCVAVDEFHPDLIVAPYLKKRIPAEVYTQYTCLVVHPGIPGDRGSSSLDWAILRDEKEWGVTILQAVEKMDAGPVWASEKFSFRNTSKACQYRHEVSQAAVSALLKAIKKFEQGNFIPESSNTEELKDKWNRATRQSDYHVNWTDSTDDTIRKINAADSSPGVLISINNGNYYCFGAHKEDLLTGKPGEILAKRNKAICMATGNAALWLTHLKKDSHDAVKLPATMALGKESELIHEDFLSAFDKLSERKTYREIYYDEHNEAGYIYFNFYNGAMSADQCRELQEIFNEAMKRNTKVIVLMGGMDLWSNGIHLNIIEASDNPAEEAWKNINALDNLIETIIRCESHYIISALHGNAGGGGVPFALAADKVVARKGIVLNPHTRSIGLYGSEYWTYLLPKRIGTERAKQFTEQCLPWGTDLAMEVKLIDECIDKSGDDFVNEVKALAEGITELPYFNKLIQAKQFKRKRDESYKPLNKYREGELAIMWKNFFEDDQRFNLKRHLFVHKKQQIEDGDVITGKDLFSERRKIWRRRKHENVYYTG